MDPPTQGKGLIKDHGNCWVAAKELIFSYYNGGTKLITVYIAIMVTKFKFPNSNPDC